MCVCTNAVYSMYISECGHERCAAYLFPNSRPGNSLRWLVPINQIMLYHNHSSCPCVFVSVFLFKSSFFGSMGIAIMPFPIFKNASGFLNIFSNFAQCSGCKETKFSSPKPQTKNVPAIISSILPFSSFTARFSSEPLIFPSSLHTIATGSSKKYAA